MSLNYVFSLFQNGFDIASSESNLRRVSVIIKPNRLRRRESGEQSRLARKHATQESRCDGRR